MEESARAAGLRPGTRLGRYTLLRRVAVGGMAELYLAHQRGAAGFSKIVALKRILPHLAEDPTFTRMFLDEARLASGLDHPHLAHVLDFGEYDGEHFLTMEYVHGHNLHEILQTLGDRELPLATSLSIVAHVARGLHDLHEQCAPDGRPLGLVHRDVSPSNVLVSYEGNVKLTDFGIAKAMALTSATRTGTFKGKLGHASPEQVRGETVDRRSDVFCLGILLYEATTGMRAFTGPNEFAIMGKVARGQYLPLSQVMPHYPVALARIVDRALRTEPDARYPTAAGVAEALESFAFQAGLRLGADPIAATMETLFGPPPPIADEDELDLGAKPTRSVSAVPAQEPRRPRALLLAVPAALLVGALGAWALRPIVESPAPTPTTTTTDRQSLATSVPTTSPDTVGTPSPSAVSPDTTGTASPATSASAASPDPVGTASPAVDPVFAASDSPSERAKHPPDASDTTVLAKPTDEGDTAPSASASPSGAASDAPTKRASTVHAKRSRRPPKRRAKTSRRSSRKRPTPTKQPRATPSLDGLYPPE